MKFRTGELTEKELEIYRAGQKSAYIDILILINPINRKFWETHETTLLEASKFAELEIKRLLERIEKAKQIYKAQQAIILAASQMTIDDLIKKD